MSDNKKDKKNGNDTVNVAFSNDSLIVCNNNEINVTSHKNLLTYITDSQTSFIFCIALILIGEGFLPYHPHI